MQLQYLNKSLIFASECYRIQASYRQSTKILIRLCGVASRLGPFLSFLTHCRLNEEPHTIYWKILISILGLSGCVINIFLEKNGGAI